MKTYRGLLCLAGWHGLYGALLWPLFDPSSCCGVRSAPAAEAQSTVDAYGDPLPQGAIRRFGTTRLRHPGGAQCVSFAADSKTLFSAGHDFKICQWDVATGRQVAIIPQAERTSVVIVSPDGARLASVGDDVVRMYDLKRQQVVWSRAVGQNRRIDVAKFSPDGVVLATDGSEDESTLRLWDVDTGDLLLELGHSRTGGGGSNIAFTSNGNLVAYASRSGRHPPSTIIEVLDLTKGAVVGHLQMGRESYGLSLAFSDDKTLISSGGRFERDQDGNGQIVADVRQWDILNGRIDPEFKIDGQRLTGEASMALSTDNSLLVTSHFGTIVVWDVATRHAQKTIAQPEHARIYRGSNSHSVAISPNKQFVAEKGIQSALRLWDLNTGAPVHLCDRTHDGEVLAIAPSPDGQLLATSGTEGAVHLWDNTSGEYVRQLHQGKGWARDVIFLPDGQHVAICGEFSDRKSPGYKGVQEIVRVSDGTVRYRKTLEGRGMRVAISHNGQLLAVGIGFDDHGFNGGEHPPEIQVWDWAQDRQVAVLKEISGRVNTLTFDDNATTIWGTTDHAPVSWRFAEEKSADNSKALANSSENVILHVYDHQSGRSFISRHISNLQWERWSNVFACVAGEQASGQSVWSRPPAKTHIADAVLSPDRKTLAVSQCDSRENYRIVILNAVDGAELMAFEVSDDSARSLAFSPDGKTLYSGMTRGDILAWDVSAVSSTQK